MCSEIPLSVDGRTAIGAISWGMAGSLLREGEMCIMFYNETVVASPCPKDPADDQIVEGRGRIRVGPQTDPPRAKARVAVVEQQCSVEPALYVVADGDHTKQMPLTHGRRLHGRARELSPATVVVVEAEVVLERIREHAPAARRVRGFIDGPRARPAGPSWGPRPGARGLRTPRGLAWQVAQGWRDRDRLGKGRSSFLRSCASRRRRSRPAPCATSSSLARTRASSSSRGSSASRCAGPSTATPSHA